MKKLTALFLTIVMCMSLGIPTFATDTSEPHVIIDDGSQRIVESYCADKRYVATYDKTKNTLTLERYSIVTGELEDCTTVERGTDTSNTAAFDNENTVLAASMSETTDMGYAYRVEFSSPVSWQLHCPQYYNDDGIIFSFACEEYEDYADQLEIFRESVDEMAVIEAKMANANATRDFYMFVGVCIAMAATPDAFISALEAECTAAEYGHDAMDLVAEYGAYQKDAYNSYWRVHSAWMELASFSSPSSIA